MKRSGCTGSGLDGGADVRELHAVARLVKFRNKQQNALLLKGEGNN
jgi:hypothetical protein